MTSSATITAVELPSHCTNPPYQFVAQLIMHLSLIHYSFSSLPKNYFWGHIRYHNCSSLTQALLGVYFKAVSIHWHSMVVWLHGYGCWNEIVKDSWRSLHKWQHVILPTYMWEAWPKPIWLQGATWNTVPGGSVKSQGRSKAALKRWPSLNGDMGESDTAGAGHVLYSMSSCWRMVSDCLDQFLP